MDQLTGILEDPQLQPFLLGGLAVLLLFLLFLLWRRRRSAASPQNTTDRRWELLNDYGQIYPSFLFILNCFRQNHGLEELLAKDDVEAAVGRLEELSRTDAAQSRKNSSLLLFPVPAARSSQVRGALLTILRGIFSDDELSKDLPPQAHQELDRFLESLTQ